MATAAELLELGKAHHVAGRLAEAEPLYRAALTADASNVEAHFLLGVVCHLLSRPDEAIVLLSRAVAGRPNHVESRHYLAVVLASRDRLDEAVAHLEEAQRQNPHSSEISANLRNVSAARCDAQGQQFAGASRWEEAAACHQEALAIAAGFRAGARQPRATRSRTWAEWTRRRPVIDAFWRLPRMWRWRITISD